MNTWHFTEGVVGVPPAIEDAINMCSAFYTGAKPHLRAGVAYRGTGIVSEFDDATGDLLAVHGYDPDDLSGASTAASALSNIPTSTMLKVQLKTDQIKNNRLIRGGIYLGPTQEGCIGDDGRVAPSIVAAVPTWLSGWISGTSSRLAVWSQPRGDEPGQYGDVVNVGVMDLPAVLRSRRD